MKAREYSALEVSSASGIATIRLNAPERKNALSPAMVNELLYAFEDARDDADVRVVVLTGSGNAFCAGGDLKQMGKGSLPPKGDFVDLMLAFRTIEKPVVAKLNGYAYGGGVGLVASCHFAVAGASVKLGTPEIARGLFPMMIMTVMQRVVPRRKLLDMMLLGERLTAAEALHIGLLSHVVEDIALDSTVDTLTEKLAAQSPTAIRLGLRAFHHQADLSLDEALPYLRDRLYELLGTEDAREGLQAFFEKREPKWKGK